MKEFKTLEIKSALKDLLKKKKITYEQLAEKMDCSVPTIKRILGPEELTLSRLLELCDLLEVSLADLEMMSQQVQEETPSFSEEQEIFLAKNKSHFTYLLKVYAGQSPKQIAEEYQLTPRSTDKYLIALEKQSLIKVTGKLKVKPAYAQFPKWGNGVLAKTYFENFIRNGADFFVSQIHEVLNSPKEKDKPTKHGYSMLLVEISKESYNAWIDEQAKAYQSFQRLADYEKRTKDPSQLMNAVLINAHTLAGKDHPGLRKIENTLGEIVNL